MEIDLTAVADEVAEKIWDARLMLTGQAPYAELDLQTKNAVKEQILPVLFHAVPVVEKSIKDKILRDIDWTPWSEDWNECHTQLEDIQREIKDL